MNELRRDPVSGRWSIIIHDELQTDKLLVNVRKRRTSGKQHEPTCPFCKGNEHLTPEPIHVEQANGNPVDWQVRVIPDKYPVLRVEGDLNNRGHGMYDLLNGIGAHEIIIETPQHGTHPADFSDDHLARVFAVYQNRIRDLKADLRFRYVMVYKNYGEATGPAVGHSYSYVIATPVTPPRVKQELINAAEHYRLKERCLFCDILHQELSEQTRVVSESEHFLAYLPFASRSPLETWIMPKQHETFFERSDKIPELASLFKRTVRGIQKILRDPNYVMVIHSGPNTSFGHRRGYWKTLEQDYHWHIEIIPQLRGFTSFELVSGIRANFLPPEKGAALLREQIASTSETES